MQINLTENQIKNLLVFLNRTQLQGNEAEAMIELKMILTKFQPSKKEKEQGKEK